MRERHLLARQQRAGTFGVHGLSESEALCKLAPKFSKFSRIRIAFDPFGDHLHPEVVRKHDRRA